MVFSEAGVPLKHVILEVTESVYLGQRDHVVADEIKSLRACGMRVALDDFGTGFCVPDPPSVRSCRYHQD
jgi:EAL domain-containing protein (putative c-di-GMP-specific phosphodiesterase class I)